jgi:hypothetical protein
MKIDIPTQSFNQQIVPLVERNYLPFLIDQLKIAVYNFLPFKTKAIKKADRTFTSNNGIWEAIIYESIRAEMNIILDSFFIFEWFPRSPGLYFTKTARMAREEAQHRIVRIEKDYIVYDPHGKLSMIQGGLGNVRLKPIEIDSNKFYLMSASTNGECHQGFPIALNNEHYKKCIEQIVDRGVAIFDLIGTLKFLPSELTNFYDGYAEVPQIYLDVKELRQSTHPKARSMENLEVSVATSFKSSYEGDSEKLYATYVTFDPSNKNSFKERIDWLKNVYIKDEYKGEILTDFDETRNTFENAPFSLCKIMNSEIDVDEFQFLERRGNRLGNQYVTFKKEITMIKNQSFKNIKDSVIATDEAEISNVKIKTFEQTQNLDLSKLAIEISNVLSELEAERQNLKERGEKTLKYDSAIGKLADAQQSVEDSDKDSAFKYLKSAGSWVADLASKVGASVITDIIKGQVS